MGSGWIPDGALSVRAVCRRLVPTLVVDLCFRLLPLPAARCRRARVVLVGTVAPAASPKLDVAEAMQRAADSIIPGLGLILLIGALLGLITISALNFYGASLTLLSVADTCKPLECTVWKRVASLLTAGVISTLLALHASGDFVTQFGNLLAILLYLFTPWTAINLVDFYVVRKGHYSIREIFNPRGMYGKWN